MTRPDPLDRPVTPADLLVLASIAEVLEDPVLAARWRWQALQVMELPARRAALRAELVARPALASAIIAELSTRLGLQRTYELVGPEVLPDGGDQAALLKAPGDPRRWTR